MEAVKRFAASLTTKEANMTKEELSTIRAAAGRKGGLTTARKYGREYMFMIAQRGGRRYIPLKIENTEKGGVATEGKTSLKLHRSPCGEHGLEHFKRLQSLHLENQAG
jgi:hypothetical protein